MLRELTAEDYKVPDDYPARLHTRSPFVAPPQNQQCVAKWLHGDVSSLGAARFDKGESCVVRSPLVDGELDDWDTIEELWREAFERAKTSGAEQPVLAATPSDAFSQTQGAVLGAAVRDLWLSRGVSGEERDVGGLCGW